jgi:AbrB family looped-hinge helix DNA binding protein
MVIPAAFRKSLDIKPGEVIVLRMEDDELRITTLRARIARAQRLARKYVKPGVSIVDEFLTERRAEAARELD